MYFDEAIAHLLERKKKWYMHKISWSRADVEAIVVVTNAASRPTPDATDYRKARGVLPWRDGDELPEDMIRRSRGGK